MIETTLDLDIQRAVARAIAGHDAMAIVLDRDGGVEAASVSAPSKRRRKKRRRAITGAKRPPLNPLSSFVDLASVSKLITVTAALAEPQSIEQVLPMECVKPLRLNDGLFYDWRAHGMVPDITHALAFSCNIAFAQLGMELGPEALVRSQTRFGFGRKPNPEVGPILLGAIVDGVVNQRGLADLGSGYAAVTTSVAHAAAIALAIGRDGDFVEPHVIKRRVTLGGDVYASSEPRRWTVVPQGISRVIARGMRAAVEKPGGTAAVLRLPGLSVAAKTGTSGDTRAGLDGLVVGFTPFDSPKHAFAVFVRGEGRASGVAAQLSLAVLKALNKKTKP